MSERSLVDWYVIYRDYIKHEDGLVNNRVMWLVTVQSFLMTTFGLSAQKIYEIQAKMDISTTLPAAVTSLSGAATAFLSVLLALSIVGLRFALISAKSIEAANAAIRSLRFKWDAGFGDAPDFDRIPKLTGGNDDVGTKNGFQSAKKIAHLFVLLWWPVTAGLGLVLIVKLLHLIRHQWPGVTHLFEDLGRLIHL